LYISTEPVKDAIIAQERIIRKIADAGSCVIVGRAAGYVLLDHSNAVKVFIHAPEEYRTAQVMKAFGDTGTATETEGRGSPLAAQGKEKISRSDSARAGYYARISGRRWGEARNYDLCINSSIGVENTATAIYEYVKNRKPVTTKNS
jgi:cytidylate kinase